MNLYERFKKEFDSLQGLQIMKLFDLILKIEKYIPAKIKTKIMMYFFRKKMKQMLPLREARYIDGTRVEVRPVPEAELARMLTNPSLIEALDNLQKRREDKLS